MEANNRGWEMVPSKRLFFQRKEKPLSTDQPLTASQDDGVIPQDDFMKKAGRRVVQVILNPDILKHVEPDDFVISMRSFQGGLERSWARGCISSAYVVLAPDEYVHVPYFAHLFKSTAYIQALQATSNLVRDGQALRYENFSMVYLPRVPRTEQRKIAVFLDRKTAAIDSLVEKKQKLLELLNEKRASLINQAVTKGLDPDVPMKDSGIPWIGEIPAHWTISRLSFRYEQQLGKMLSPEATTGSEQAPYLANKDVQWKNVRVDDLSTMSFSAGERRKFSLHKGDLLVCEGGEAGRTAIWQEELRDCYFQKAIHRLRPHSAQRDHPLFQYYSMFAAKAAGAFEELGNKSTIGHLTGEALRAHRFPWPPYEEQRAIASSLDLQTDRLGGAAQKIETQITRLQEYRQALITAAVTGQLEIPDEEAAS